MDFRTLGELVHQQDLAQSLFETKLVPDEAPVIEDPVADAHAAELSSWGPRSCCTPPKAARGPRGEAQGQGPRNDAPAGAAAAAAEKSWLPTAVAIAGALALAVALVWYLLAD